MVAKQTFVSGKERHQVIFIGRYNLINDMENNKLFLVKDDKDEIEINHADLEELLDDFYWKIKAGEENA